MPPVRQHLEAGKPARDEDTWFRYITNRRHLRRDGKLNHAAFKGRALVSSGQCWELSGRLLSLAGAIEDVRKHGANHAEAIRSTHIAQGRSGKEFVFVGVLYSVVSAIRSYRLTADVVYDPTEDLAHANVVFPEVRLDNELPAAFLDDLAEMFEVALPESLSRLFEGGGSAP